MNETDYNARLYEKMKAEQDKYRDWLLHQEPSEILNHTYEYIVGHNDGNVYPNGLISRAKTATVFFRLLKDEVRDGNLLTSNTYSDVPDDYWANTAISTMTGLGIVQGHSGTTFDPEAPSRGLSLPPFAPGLIPVPAAPPRPSPTSADTGPRSISGELPGWAGSRASRTAPSARMPTSPVPRL